MLITRTNIFGDISTMEINISPEEYAMFLLDREKPRRDQTMVQDMFPDLSTDEREFLITGITPEYFARMWR